MKNVVRMMMIVAVPGMIGASAAAVAQMMTMQPGLWEYNSTTTAVDMPGAPPAVVKMMTGKKMTIRHCVSAAEANQGPQSAMKKNPSCAITYHVGPGGRFSSNMSCKEDAYTMNMVSTGTVSPVAFTSMSQMKMTGAQPMTMASTWSGHRLGECHK